MSYLNFITIRKTRRCFHGVVTLYIRQDTKGE